MIIDNLGLAGRLNIVLTDANGNIKDERTVKNLVVNSGLGYITDRMTANTTSVMSHMGVGSDNTSVDPADTDLGTLVGSRKALDSDNRSGSDNESIVYIATFDPGEATGALTEAGIFNASTSGVMLCRTVFSVINKAAGDTLQITWTITLSAS
jgi:hypothetical protein